MRWVVIPSLLEFTMYPRTHMMTFELSLSIWPFPTMQILFLPQRSAHGDTAVGDVIGVGEAVGVAVPGSGVGVAFEVSFRNSMAVSVDVGARVGTGVAVGVAVLGSGVGVAVGVAVDVGCPLGEAVGDAVGAVGPARAGVVSASATPNTIRLPKNFANRFITVISPAAAPHPEPPSTQTQGFFPTPRPKPEKVSPRNRKVPRA
jgi:hypothetical protein